MYVCIHICTYIYTSVWKLFADSIFTQTRTHVSKQGDLARILNQFELVRYTIGKLNLVSGGNKQRVNTDFETSSSNASRRRYDGSVSTPRNLSLTALDECYLPRQIGILRYLGIYQREDLFCIEEYR